MNTAARDEKRTNVPEQLKNSAPNYILRQTNSHIYIYIYIYKLSIKNKC